MPRPVRTNAGKQKERFDPSQSRKRKRVTKSKKVDNIDITWTSEQSEAYDGAGDVAPRYQQREYLIRGVIYKRKENVVVGDRWHKKLTSIVWEKNRGFAIIHPTRNETLHR